MAIIVVDDEKDLLLEIVESLIEFGYSASAFTSAEEVMPFLADPAIDTLITDMRLPGISGKELIV